MNNSEPKKKFPLGGVKAAADLLADLDSATRDRIMREIAERDPVVHQKLQHKLVRFETLLKVEPALLQSFLRQIPIPKFALALRGLDESTRDAFFSHVPKATREALLEEIHLQGPQQVSTIELTRRELIALAREAKLPL